MNKVQLAGTVYNQPTLKATPNSIVARLMLKVDNTAGKGFKLVPITAWGEVAQSIGDNFNKDSKLQLEGELETSSYINKEGNKIYTWGVRASKVGQPTADQETPF